MKIQKYISIALTGLALSLSNASFADVDTLAKNLKNNYPNLSAKVVGESPVDDIYEVQVAGNLVYTNEDARYFFVGNLVDFKNKTNVTEQRQQELSQIDISQLPLEDAIKNKKNTVHETADVIYHLLVTLESAGINFDDIIKELNISDFKIKDFYRLKIGE